MAKDDKSVLKTFIFNLSKKFVSRMRRTRKIWRNFGIEIEESNEKVFLVPLGGG